MSDMMQRKIGGIKIDTKLNDFGKMIVTEVRDITINSLDKRVSQIQKA